MTLEDAYVEGFCKAAEAMNVDPVALIKAAQTTPLIFNPGTGRYQTTKPTASDMLRGNMRGFAKNFGGAMKEKGKALVGGAKNLANAASQSSANVTTNAVNATTNKWNELLKKLRAGSMSMTNSIPQSKAVATNAVNDISSKLNSILQAARAKSMTTNAPAAK